jgi:hypothetical protein
MDVEQTWGRLSPGPLVLSNYIPLKQGVSAEKYKVAPRNRAQRGFAVAAKTDVRGKETGADELTKKASRVTWAISTHTSALLLSFLASAIQQWRLVSIR